MVTCSRPKRCSAKQALMEADKQEVEVWADPRSSFSFCSVRGGLRAEAPPAPLEDF